MNIRVEASVKLTRRISKGALHRQHLNESPYDFPSSVHGGPLFFSDGRKQVLLAVELDDRP